MTLLPGKNSAISNAHILYMQNVIELKRVTVQKLRKDVGFQNKALLTFDQREGERSL